jgi:WD repeat-containing protein 48
MPMKLMSPIQRTFEKTREVSDQISHARCDTSLLLTPISAVNLGKWIMRNLFSSLIEEEIKRDEAYRKELMAKYRRSNGLQRGNPPLSITMPGSEASSGDSQTTPRPLGGFSLVPNTPGLSIGVATPGIPPPHVSSLAPNHLPSTAEEDRGSEPGGASNDQSSTVGTRPDDYFSPNSTTQPSEASSESNQKLVSTPSEKGPDTVPTSPVDEKDEKKKGSLFGKKFQMNFGTMKLGRIGTESKSVPAPQEEKSEDASDKSSEKERTFGDNFFGVIQRIRHDYDEQLQSNPNQPLITGITPSLPEETPLLRQPPHTLVLVQEDNPEAGGVVDIFRGAIGTLGADVETVERVAPAWLGDLLVRVRLKGVIPIRVANLGPESRSSQRDGKGLFHFTTTPR